MSRAAEPPEPRCLYSYRVEEGVEARGCSEEMLVVAHRASHLAPGVEGVEVEVKIARVVAQARVCLQM